MVMVAFRIRRRLSACRVALGLLVCLVSSVSAQEEPRAKERLKVMREAVDSLEPESAELKTKAALTFASKPLLRYSDPTRDDAEVTGNVLLDATVWRLGTEGRPSALVTVELYQAAKSPTLLSYEFLSLSEAKLSLKHKADKVPRFDPTESGLTLKELPDAPKPAATAGGRLAQMRRLARRFTAKEQYRNVQIECRLLSQPIDRYQSAAQKILDAAIFVYANGTNPELGVVLETDGDHWQYGTIRLTGTEASVSLDGRQVTAYEQIGPRNRRGPYQLGSYRLEIDK
jgi:hypothetical protein